MQTLYHKIRTAITSAFPDYDLKTESSPEKQPDLYECRLVVNSGTPFAIHLAKDGPDKLMLAIFPALSKNNHAEKASFEIFTNNGLRFTFDDGESFMITNIPGKRNLSVFHLTQTDVSVDEYIKMSEDVLMENILSTLTRFNKKGGAMDSGG